MIGIRLNPRRIIQFIMIFLFAQLSLWHDGIADFIPAVLLNSWNKIQLASTLLIPLLFLMKRKTPNVVSLIFIAAETYLLLVSFFSFRELDIVRYLRFINLVLLIDLYSDELNQALSPILLVLEFMIYYNMFVCISNGPDIYGSYYGSLGYDNGFIAYFLPAYFWALLYMCIKKKYMRAIALIVAIHITLLYTWSVTGLVSFILLDVFCIWMNCKRFNLSLIKSYIVLIILEVLVVFFQVQRFFSFLIVDILGKDITFTGRSTVWEHAIEKISKRPLFGYGYMSQLEENVILGDVYCHNAILEQLFRGGIIYYGLFVLAIVLISYQTKRYSQNPTYKRLIYCICAVWISGLLESILDNYSIYIMFSVLAVFPKIERCHEKSMLSVKKRRL